MYQEFLHSRLFCLEYQILYTLSSKKRTVRIISLFFFFTPKTGFFTDILRNQPRAQGQQLKDDLSSKCVKQHCKEQNFLKKKNLLQSISSSPDITFLKQFSKYKKQYCKSTRKRMGGGGGRRETHDTGKLCFKYLHLLQVVYFHCLLQFSPEPHQICLLFLE